MARIQLKEIAHARSGDKGQKTNISLIFYEQGMYEKAEEKVTADRIEAHFSHITDGDVERYDLPQIGAFNFVINQTRPLGVAASLDFDAHGKSLSWHLLEMEIEV
ncbi:hypothetical protein [Alteribacillus sp. HJP-4]|uniref:AtuA-related protein n=1 Tax=Alteribacillus sp. HJP-4 TaxID=2775394 RepID=UPI0035CCCACC